MRKKDIERFRLNHSVGQRIKAPKMMSNDKMQLVDAEIVGIYPWHCLVQAVTDPKYKWSVRWYELIVIGV